MSNLTPRDASTRAADTDRIQVAQLLTEAASRGRLALSEYEQRLAKAYAAQTYEELDRLTEDLPEAADASNRRGASNPAPKTLLLAILSGFERRGRWNVPGRITTFTLFGGGVVDLRYADFTSANVEIHAYSIMGGQTILLPPEINVEVHGVGVMGGFDHDVDGPGTPGAPKVTIRGFSLWGGVGVKRKNRKPNAPESR
ncbi:DUF1707 SHOCT-like domain-containing protein [Mycolicibacterium aichiense]|uniref:DUF1707 domain-containing protein n=1 Tax=Mycolicibacterium aichiense TaxID=1799 RepID=A0AAD1M9J3_9MYCO|nr:DUF1707 domain-containing protein [Mycolicibacterium aichiense]MCV7021570.1 DUF1707 and DUF2154 domain-containing protein [Mycolicibacterium aichiense]BBX06152.1 hypothetical protein MAIC_09550 [Mycolicibacterium aichiense]STZ24508.1 protein of uncharacterised function (DUF1707) [Mycolicibacterium aichiense]